MDIREKITLLIKEATQSLGLPKVAVVLEHPADLSHGDYATNIALVLAKQSKTNPKDLATRIAKTIKDKKPSFIDRVETAGPGFINFHLSRSFFTESLREIRKSGDDFGRGDMLRGERYLVEFTDPNPFKEFHIGHLMSNAIGESISRLFASQGAKVKRMCYQGDIGPHVAKCLWAMKKNREELPSRGATILEKSSFLGRMYTQGSRAYEDDPIAKQEIDEINRAIYDGKGRDLMKLYKRGRKWSLQSFDEIYRILGTKFDYFILESEIAHDGLALIEKYRQNGVFEESEGAIVFRAEKHDSTLHTRVFVNSQGLPTYDAKELGLNMKKWKKIRPDRSVIITANEQSGYFRVVLKALELIAPDVRAITEHISHGMMRFADGKMSSRTGNVVTARMLIDEVMGLVEKKLSGRDIPESERRMIAEVVAISAIKYSILRQVPSSDIIFDFNTSISFEGDSGPYLLYSIVRARSILSRARRESVKAGDKKVPEQVTVLERMLYRFSHIVSRAQNERAPQHIATYLIEIASAFNSWYGSTQIVAKDDQFSPYHVAITEAFSIVMSNGLYLLGIRIPPKM